MIALATAFMTFFGSTAARIMTDRVVMMVALKALLATLLMITLPIVLNNFIADMVNDAMSWMQGQAIDGEWGGVAQFSGIAGWLIVKFRLSEVLAVTLSALQIHLLLKIMPFSPVK